MFALSSHRDNKSNVAAGYACLSLSHYRNGSDMGRTYRKEAVVDRKSAGQLNKHWNHNKKIK